MTDEARAAWAAAFVAAQQKLPEVAKTKTAKIPTKSGSDYSYTYADLSDVLSMCRPVLNDFGLSVTQSVGGTADAVAVSTRIYHESGHVEEFGPTTLPAGHDARGTGSAVTYARRYGLCAALGIMPDDDDDGAAHQPVRHEPAFDAKEYARTRVQQFTEWDEDRRKQEWMLNVDGLFDGKKPSNKEAVDSVIEAMGKTYYAETGDDPERPF